MMPKIISALTLLTLNERQVQNELHKAFVEVLRSGVQVWVLEAAQHIPIWSGASQSTLKTLAGTVGVQIAVFPVSGAPNRVGLGASSGSGSLFQSKRNGIYGFFYATNLPYLIRNETRDMSAAMLGRLKRPTPYEFRKKADDAFNRHVRDRLAALPMGEILQRAIKTKQVRVS